MPGLMPPEPGQPLAADPARPAPGMAPGPQMGPEMGLDDDEDLDGGEPASPEEQEIYNRFVAGGMMMMYDERFFPRFGEMMKSQEPKEGVADAVSMVATRTVQESKKAGFEIPGDVVLAGTKELTEQAADAALKFGVDLPEPDVEEAYYLALDKTRVALQGAGLMEPEAMAEDQQTLKGMRDDGRLEQVLAMVREAQGSSGSAGKFPTRPTDGADLPGSAI